MCISLYLPCTNIAQSSWFPWSTHSYCLTDCQFWPVAAVRLSCLPLHRLEHIPATSWEMFWHASWSMEHQELAYFSNWSVCSSSQELPTCFLGLFSTIDLRKHSSNTTPNPTRNSSSWYWTRNSWAPIQAKRLRNGMKVWDEKWLGRTGLIQTLSAEFPAGTLLMTIFTRSRPTEQFRASTYHFSSVEGPAITGNHGLGRKLVLDCLALDFWLLHAFPSF